MYSEELMRLRYSELESISKSYSTFAVYDRPLQFKISSWTWGEVLVESFKPELTGCRTRFERGNDRVGHVWEPVRTEWSHHDHVPAQHGVRTEETCIPRGEDE